MYSPAIDRKSIGIMNASDRDGSLLVQEHHHLKQHEAIVLSSFSKLLLIDENDDFLDDQDDFIRMIALNIYLYKEYVIQICNIIKLDIGFGEYIILMKNRENDYGDEKVFILYLG